MPGLINKLGDSKIVVRQANIRVISTLMSTLRPRPVLDALAGALIHTDWRVREEAINVIIQASPNELVEMENPKTRTGTQPELGVAACVGGGGGVHNSCILLSQLHSHCFLLGSMPEPTRGFTHIGGEPMANIFQYCF